MPMYHRIKKRYLVVVFHFHGDVLSQLLRVHVQKKVIDSGSCRDNEGVVDVSLPYPGDVFLGKRSHGLLFKSLHKLIGNDCGNWSSNGFSLKLLIKILVVHKLG